MYSSTLSPLGEPGIRKRCVAKQLNNQRVTEVEQGSGKAQIQCEAGREYRFISKPENLLSSFRLYGCLEWI